LQLPLAAGQLQLLLPLAAPVSGNPDCTPLSVTQQRPRSAHLAPRTSQYLNKAGYTAGTLLIKCVQRCAADPMSSAHEPLQWTFYVRLAEWVSPVGGALSRHTTSTWQVQATGVHRRGRVAPRSKQPRRCQAAEGSRRPGAPTGGGKNTPFSICVLRRQIGVCGLESFGLSVAILLLRREVNAGLNQLAQKEQHAAP
jgi:hypothetical protein